MQGWTALKGSKSNRKGIKLKFYLNSFGEQTIFSVFGENLSSVETDIWIRQVVQTQTFLVLMKFLMDRSTFWCYFYLSFSDHYRVDWWVQKQRPIKMSHDFADSDLFNLIADSSSDKTHPIVRLVSKLGCVALSTLNSLWNTAKPCPEMATVGVGWSSVRASSTGLNTFKYKRYIHR